MKECHCAYQRLCDEGMPLCKGLYLEDVVAVIQCYLLTVYCKSGHFLQCNIFGEQRKMLFGRDKFSVPRALPL